jgi:hypothetical protein
MLKVTPDDLQRQSSAELCSIFNHVQLGIVWLMNPSAERSSALRLLAMIRAEQVRRALKL